MFALIMKYTFLIENTKEIFVRIFVFDKETWQKQALAVDFNHYGWSSNFRLKDFKGLLDKRDERPFPLRAQ